MDNIRLLALFAVGSYNTASSAPVAQTTPFAGSSPMRFAQPANADGFTASPFSQLAVPQNRFPLSSPGLDLSQNPAQHTAQSLPGESSNLPPGIAQLLSMLMPLLQMLLPFLMQLLGGGLGNMAQQGQPQQQGSPPVGSPAQGMPPAQAPARQDRPQQAHRGGGEQRPQRAEQPPRAERREQPAKPEKPEQKDGPSTADRRRAIQDSVAGNGDDKKPSGAEHPQRGQDGDKPAEASQPEQPTGNPADKPPTKDEKLSDLPAITSFGPANTGKPEDKQQINDTIARYVAATFNEEEFPDPAVRRRAQELCAGQILLEYSPYTNTEDPSLTKANNLFGITVPPSKATPENSVYIKSQNQYFKKYGSLNECLEDYKHLMLKRYSNAWCEPSLYDSAYKLREMGYYTMDANDYARTVSVAQERFGPYFDRYDS